MAETEKQMQPEQVASETKNKQVPPRPRRGGVVFAILLSLTAIGSVAYLGYRLEFQLVPQLESDRQQIFASTEEMTVLRETDDSLTERLQSHVESLQSLLDQQTSEVGALSAQLKKSNSEFAEKINAVIESTSAIQDNSGQRPKDWQIDDIALLLLIGTKQLQLTHDPTAVLPIWNAADQQIGRSTDPQMLIVRTRIGDEIEKLKAMEVVDIESVSELLLKLVDQVESLPLRTQLTDSSRDLGQGVEEPADQPNSSDESSDIVALWTDLKSLVRVQKIDDTSTLPLNPNLAGEMTQQLKTSLLAAQIAALQGQTRIYQANLEYVQSVLGRYFDTEVDTAVEFADALDRLIHTPVIAQIPDVSGSYQLLQQILDRTPIE